MLEGITWWRNATPIQGTCVRAKFVREDFFGAGPGAQAQEYYEQLLHYG
jgi:hypothetical protein